MDIHIHVIEVKGRADRKKNMLKLLKRFLWWFLFFTVLFSIGISFAKGEYRVMIWQASFLVMFMASTLNARLASELHDRIKSHTDLVDALLKEGAELKELIGELKKENAKTNSHPIDPIGTRVGKKVRK